MKKNFKVYMLENDITSVELAKILNLSESSISHKLKGRNSFSLYEVNQIRLHLNLSDRKVVELFLENSSRERSYVPKTRKKKIL